METKIIPLTYSWFLEKGLVYTLLINTIHLSYNTQVTGTVFRNHIVCLVYTAKKIPLPFSLLYIYVFQTRVNISFNE